MEQYSKESYDKLDQEAHHSERVADIISHDQFGKKNSEGISYEEAMRTPMLTLHTLDELSRQVREAKERLAKMYEISHEEAKALNEQYNALLANLNKSADEVYNFEKEKLGMHQEKK